MACEETGRICYGIELDEKFVDVIVKRYYEATEDQAIKVVRDGKEYRYSDLTE